MSRGLALATLVLAVSTASLAGEPGMAPAAAEPMAVGSTMQTHLMLTNGDVVWGEGPSVLPPGAKMAVIEGDPKAANALFTVRFKLPDGYRISPHFHPADEHITVLSGTFNMGMGDSGDPKSAIALPAGGFAVMPKGEHHYAFATGETVVQLHGVGPWGLTYVNPADDPRNVIAN